MSPDPYKQHFSPYLGMGNQPQMRVDPDGGCDDPPCGDGFDLDENGNQIGTVELDGIVAPGIDRNTGYSELYGNAASHMQNYSNYLDTQRTITTAQAEALTQMYGHDYDGFSKSYYMQQEYERYKPYADKRSPTVLMKYGQPIFTPSDVRLTSSGYNQSGIYADNDNLNNPHTPHPFDPSLSMSDDPNLKAGFGESGSITAQRSKGIIGIIALYQTYKAITGISETEKYGEFNLAVTKIKKQAEKFGQAMGYVDTYQEKNPSASNYDRNSLINYVYDGTLPGNESDKSIESVGNKILKAYDIPLRKKEEDF